MPQLAARTSLPFDVFQQRFDEAFARSHGPQFLTRSWNGSTLHLEGSGCRGDAVFDQGHLSGELELSLPARFISNRIFDEIAQVLRDAGCEDVRVG